MSDKKFLFLDDCRIPTDCADYMSGIDVSIYKNEHWNIVRNYREFVEWIRTNGLPDLISFDHDLAIGHYHKNMQQGKLNYESADFENDDHKTGFHCAKFLVDYCIDNKKPLPDFVVHSMNPVGKENIKGLLNSFKIFQTENL